MLKGRYSPTKKTSEYFTHNLYEIELHERLLDFHLSFVWLEINTIAYDVIYFFPAHANKIPSHFIHECKTIAHDVINVNVYSCTN